MQPKIHITDKGKHIMTEKKSLTGIILSFVGGLFWLNIILSIFLIGWLFGVATSVGVEENILLNIKNSPNVIKSTFFKNKESNAPISIQMLQVLQEVENLDERIFQITKNGRYDELIEENQQILKLVQEIRNKIDKLASFQNKETVSQDSYEQGYYYISK